MNKIKLTIICFTFSLALNSCRNGNNKNSIKNVESEKNLEYNNNNIETKRGDTLEIDSEKDSSYENITDENTNQIMFSDFKNSVIGKSMDEVKKIYGIPCKAQELMNIKAWYYGTSVCKDEIDRIKIINEDSQKEIEMV